MIKFSEDTGDTSQIIAIGIGGAGCSVIDKINLKEINTILLDADTESLDGSTAREKISIPTRLVKELGTETGNLVAGPELAKELKPFIESLPKAEIIFTISGLGGSTGTAITPYLVQLLREKSHWVWSLCTIPFFFEGRSKILNSLKRLKSIQQSANTVLVIPHDKIFKMVDKSLSMKEAFTPANNLFAELVSDIGRLTCPNGKGDWINIKFSDIKGRIVGKKTTSFGIGEGSGESRIQMAIEQAVSGPLLDKDVLNSADGLILSVSGSKTLILDEVNKGVEFLRTFVSKNTDIIFGIAIEPILKDKVKVGIITTGIDISSDMDSWGLSTASIAKETASIKKTSILNRPSQEGKKPTQTMIDFRKLQKGRFERSEATVFGGVDLDVPTFLRKKKS